MDLSQRAREKKKGRAVGFTNTAVYKSQTRRGNRRVEGGREGGKEGRKEGCKECLANANVEVIRKVI